MPENAPEEIARLERLLEASDNRPGYAERVEAIKAALKELRDAA